MIRCQTCKPLVHRGRTCVDTMTCINVKETLGFLSLFRVWLNRRTDVSDMDASD